jgi:glycosyltransferase involved in cell wall biosynthesis
MASLSVVVITYNEARNIARCLQSVQEVADEIIVLDSNSTDDTAAIATAMGAKLTLQPFLGYIEQKNKALSLASHDYVLCLDADEALDETLSAQIKKEKGQFRFDAYTMNRCTWYCGRFIRHGSWYPDRKLRLFNRHKARWGGINPHDKVEWQQPGSAGHLKGDILHYSYNTLEEHIQQNNRFSTISAEAYYQKGKKAQLWHLLVKPCWAFLSSYLLKAGFLDGLFGFIIAKNIAHLTFMKYYKLKALQEGWPVKQVS